MTRKEIEKVNELAKANGGDMKAAAREFLALPDNADNNAAAVNGIVDEVEQWNEADEETRAGIEAYKAAKDTVEETTAAEVKKPNGRTRAKSK